MRDNSGQQGYTLTAIVLHWMSAALIAAGFILGLYMITLALSPQKLRFFSYHKWMGVTVFWLVFMRLFWRAFHPAPDLPGSMAPWERAAARGAHILLYAFMIAVPIAGWLMSSAHGFKTVYLGVLPLPDLLRKNKELASTLELVHYVLNRALLVTVAAHAAAALKHHFIDRDNVLVRMFWPGERP